MIKINKMEEKHLEQVASIEKEIFSVPWSKEAFNNSINLDNTSYYVALEEDAVVGYCGIYKVMNLGDITNVAVTPKKRKQGIAFKLVEKMICDATKEGVTEVMLEVRESNFPAISLYEKIGFKKITKRKEYYKHPKEDAIVMLKKIR